MGLSFTADYVSERVCHGACSYFSQTDGIDELFSVILRLNAHKLLAFVYIFVECTLSRQSPIAKRVLHKRH